MPNTPLLLCRPSLATYGLQLGGPAIFGFLLAIKLLNISIGFHVVKCIFAHENTSCQNMGIVPGGEALLGRALALGFILHVGRWVMWATEQNLTRRPSATSRV